MLDEKGDKQIRMSFSTEATSSVSDAVPTFKSFISEEQVEEKRKQRQAEWEKVRKPEDPLEAPEEVYDGRSLFDRLQEQKLKKEEEAAEKHRLSNQVQGIDEDEADFLEFVNKRKGQLDKERNQDDELVLQEYRESLVTRATSKDPATKTSKTKATKEPSSKPKSQQALLAGAVKRKSTDTNSETDTKRLKDVTDDTGSSGDGPETSTVVVASGRDPKLARVVAVLPGLGEYSNSSDSESSSSDSDFEFEPKKSRLQNQAANQSAHK